ncbi:NAD(P)/FAD-dependent oxidoreductase [Nitrosomonas sp. JL21]|uniref:flavin-containing monooxygenase n=1 Tax=Nitrosomonas sp. JL21 TaxID=153949 RepID=UPI0013696080|nr:NAD(P)/FAD-dependent oxidoreductase [Nitrosomonas sp. JL21]MBL8497697.1 NAD(P)/FAD-dependent oxidoreductase [Nitrosomonas sp.]MCC7091207.1 NAD(P)/FAD-dependent oxidoreductase [Nitrosomonas sp.]MXS78360.1 NAD(P)/FAD-dependent oxidoreductase [Nitrosomonas sp. JL21]
MENNDIHDVTVIGAGPAGLSVAYELVNAGIKPFVVERTAVVGDVWRNHYDGVRLNSGRYFSALSGSKFPLSAGSWPSREEVVRLLETFPTRGGFTVHTDIDIDKVSYDRQRDIWLITSTEGKHFESRAVVMAIGGCRIPVIPNWEGVETFSGEILHSSKFKNAQAFSGKHILVVGSGNSAAEIASKLTDHASSVTVSVRTAPHILPKSIYGIPLIGIGVWTRSWPTAWVDGLLRFLQHSMIGDLSAHGLPYPDLPLSKQYAINNVVPILYRPFVDDVRAGRIKIVGPIQKITGKSVHVLRHIHTSPTEENDLVALEPDVIIAGTGFRTGISKLVQVPGIADKDDRSVIAGDQEFKDAPRLYFIGQINPLSGLLREIRLEAGRIVQKIKHQL